jgi:hypothetical protein
MKTIEEVKSQIDVDIITYMNSVSSDTKIIDDLRQIVVNAFYTMETEGLLVQVGTEGGPSAPERVTLIDDNGQVIGKIVAPHLKT